MKYLGVDPGEKRIGIAVSDPAGRIARPLTILPRRSYSIDAIQIYRMAMEHGIGTIVIGQSFDDEGQPTFIGRQAARLADAILKNSSMTVILWDEAFSTQDAFQAGLEMGLRRKERRSRLDDRAAAVMLQSYLDAGFSRG